MYSDTDILIAMEKGNIIIDPFDPDQLQINSYDVCLGNTFYEVFWDNEGPFFIGPYIYSDGDKVKIPIGGTLLGVTKERIGTNGKVVAELRSKSSTRRVGVTTNCDAGLGDIGYNTFWTMEFTAFVEIRQLNFFNLPNPILRPPSLIIGQTVAQMVFYECESEPTRKYSGQYQAEWPLNMIPKEWRHRIIAP